jgi:hypothetical protein
MNKSDYISSRLSNNKDDRESSIKLNMDAELRGSIGEKEANRIIKLVDTEKQRSW